MGLNIIILGLNDALHARSCADVGCCFGRRCRCCRSRRCHRSRCRCHFVFMHVRGRSFLRVGGISWAQGLNVGPANIGFECQYLVGDKINCTAIPFFLLQILVDRKTPDILLVNLHLTVTSNVVGHAQNLSGHKSCQVDLYCIESRTLLPSFFGGNIM